MPKFIKLTEKNNELWYVNISSIISLNEESNYTRVVTNDCYLFVKETPLEILKLIAECDVRIIELVQPLSISG